MSKSNKSEPILNPYLYTGFYVSKKSGKPFKSGHKVNKIKSVINHPIIDVLAFTFEDDNSYVSVSQCKIEYDFSKLQEPEYYFNIKTGDLMVIFHAICRPIDLNWVEISKEAYSIHWR